MNLSLLLKENSPTLFALFCSEKYPYQAYQKQKCEIEKLVHLH